MATLNHGNCNSESPAALEEAKVSTHPSWPPENPEYGLKQLKYFFFSIVVVSNVLADLENQYLVLFLLFVMGEGGLSMCPPAGLELVARVLFQPSRC